MNQVEFINNIKPFKDKMFRLAKRLLVSTEEAEDTTQDILEKLWNKNDNLHELKNLEAYAMTITKNHCLDVLKSKRASNMQLVHSNYEEKNSGLVAKLENTDSLQFVEKWINELPEQQKLIIQMRDVEQYEFEEIAKILEISEATIRVALSRARKTIREKLTKTHNYGIA